MQFHSKYELDDEVVLKGDALDLFAKKIIGITVNLTKFSYTKSYALLDKSSVMVVNEDDIKCKRGK